MSDVSPTNSDVTVIDWFTLLQNNALLRTPQPCS